MTPTWTGGAPPKGGAIGIMGGLRGGLRGLALILVILCGLAVLVPLRVVERALCGAARPWTPAIPQAVCRVGLVIVGLRLRVEGRPSAGRGAIVANHASWLDIFVLNTAARVSFVAKSEVAGWPGIGWLARAAGTVFVRRDPRDAARQRDIFRDRLAAGHRLLFFPEGTSTDGLRVLDFKPTLFAAFIDDRAGPALSIQPASVIYTAPDGADPRFYGWWGDMEFGAHLLRMLAARRHGSARVVFHAPLEVGAFTDRKALARAAEASVREGFTRA